MYYRINHTKWLQKNQYNNCENAKSVILNLLFDFSLKVRIHYIL